MAVIAVVVLLTPTSCSLSPFLRLSNRDDPPMKARRKRSSQPMGEQRGRSLRRFAKYE